MASIIRLCPLSGGVGEDTPHCYLLEVDQFTFLLDCGWDPKFSEAIQNELKKHVHKIDAVLLSHPDNLHIGALPYAVGKLGMSIIPSFSNVRLLSNHFDFQAYHVRYFQQFPFTKWVKCFSTICTNQDTTWKTLIYLLWMKLTKHLK